MMRQNLLEPVAPQLILPGVDGKNFRGGKHKWMDSSSTYLLQERAVCVWLHPHQHRRDQTVRTSIPGRNSSIPSSARSHPMTCAAPAQAGDRRRAGSTGDLASTTLKAFCRSAAQVLRTTVGWSKALCVAPPIAFGTIQNEVERYKAAGFANIATVLPDDAPGYLTGGYSVLKQPSRLTSSECSDGVHQLQVHEPARTGRSMNPVMMIETSWRLD